MGGTERYTCTEYRMEMILLGLQRRLHRPDLSDKEKQELETEIERVKAEMGMN